MINVSDDEDLMTAYEVAKKEMLGNLKITVAFKDSAVKNAAKET